MNDQRFEHHRPLALITDEAQTDPTECFFPEWKTVDENVNQIIYTIVDRGIVQCFFIRLYLNKNTPNQRKSLYMKKLSNNKH